MSQIKSSIVLFLVYSRLRPLIVFFTAIIIYLYFYIHKVGRVYIYRCLAVINQNLDLVSNKSRTKLDKQGKFNYIYT